MNSQPQSSSSVLSIEDQRQIIYATLLAFSPEAMELRQQALEGVVLNGLLGSTEDAPYKLDKIQKNLKKRPHATELREHLIRDTLAKLSKEGKVKRFDQKSSKAYCLTQKGEDQIKVVLGQAVDIFDSVLRHMLEHTQALVPFETAAAVCRAFIMECFGKFGREIARSVMGRLDKQALARTSEVNLAFDAAVQGRKLSEDVQQSLYQRCVQFIRSSEPQDEKLKFQLTQAFFLAELLCIEGIDFDPLHTQAFKGAVFYLDTNVVILGLLTEHHETSSFGEMLRRASGLGIELRITRATINEARRVIANRQEDLEKYLAKVPVEVTHLTHDSFLAAYHHLGAVDPNLTPAKFFERFVRLTDILQQDWGVIIHDVTEDQILGKTTLDKESIIIQEETMNSRRGLVKSEQVLRHDLALLALIRKERRTNRKTWLLTVDRSLIRAASQLAPPAALVMGAGAGLSREAQANTFKVGMGDELPFCFSLAGFLQCISPFTAYTERRSIVDIFSTLVAEHLSLSEKLFDMREMNLMMEWHEDVMTTPAEQLIPLLDYVKTLIDGRQYTKEDMPKVALGLRKMLSKSAEERNEALVLESQRYADKVKEEQRARANAEQALEEERRKHEAQKVAHAEEVRRAQLAATSRQWRDRMIFGLVVGAVFWFFQDGLVAAVLSKGLNGPMWENLVRAVVISLAAMSILIPTIFFLKSVSWRGETIALAISLVVLVILAGTSFLKDETLSRWSSLIQIAVLGGQIVYLLLTRNRKLNN